MEKERRELIKGLREEIRNLIGGCSASESRIRLVGNEVYELKGILYLLEILVEKEKKPVNVNISRLSVEVEED